MGVFKKEIYDIIVKCKNCREIYKLNPKERTYSEAIKLYIEGNSGRAAGRILGISKNICLYWIRKYAKTLANKSYPN